MTVLVDGAVVGAYTIVRRIATGGMGGVYQARHAALRRDAALKVLLPHLLGDAEMIRRLDREARAIASLKHPHIVEIYDADITREPYYLAMEYHVRGSLEMRLSELRRTDGRMSIDDAIRVTYELAEALAFAHARGFVHRDLKPSNVLIADDGRAVLSDFGLAASQFSMRLTGSQVALGTPAYMSPEQVKGEKAGPRSDLYSLGIMLHEMLTGDVPFLAESPYAVMYKQVSEAAPPVRNYRLDVPEDLCRILDGLLAKNADQRIADAATLCASLRSLEATQRGAAPTLLTTSGDSSTSRLRAIVQQLLSGRHALPTPAPQLRPQRAVSRARVLIGASVGTGAAVVAMGVAAVLSLRGSQPVATATPLPTSLPAADAPRAQRATSTPTNTPTPLPTNAPTQDPTETPAPVFIAAPTETAPPTETAVPTAAPTETPTVVPTRPPSTATALPSPTETPAPPPTPTAAPSIAVPTSAPPESTAPPPQPTAPPTPEPTAQPTAPAPEPTRTTAPP